MLALGATGAFADETATQANKVVKQYAKAVVEVEAVLTISAGGRGQEKDQNVQAIGTVVDPSGLTVTSYVSLNPTSVLKSLPIQGGGRVSISGELSDVKICLPDGTEIPARIVLKDEDLDLAFIMPKDKLDKDAAEQIAAVDLAKPAPKAGLLDQIVRISRLGKDMNRALVAELDRISAIVTKPRLVYVIGGAQPGSPVFSMAGKLLGIVTFHKRAGRSASVGRSGIGGIPVILPTKDVNKIADQAHDELKKISDKQAKEPETKKADDEEKQK